MVGKRGASVAIGGPMRRGGGDTGSGMDEGRAYFLFTLVSLQLDPQRQTL